jgi:hypothetical protein
LKGDDTLTEATRPMRSVATFLAPLLLLAACGTSGATPTPSDDGTAGGEPVLVIVNGRNVPDGGGITVAEAIEHQPTDDIVLVTGTLFVLPDGSVTLCDAIAESFPPQCAGASIAVEGLDLASVPDLQEANGVQWAERVTLLGSVE